MAQSYDRFYIPLPGSKKTLPQTLHRDIPQHKTDPGWENYTPYLRGVPSLPDFLAHLSNGRDLTKAEVDCLTKQVCKLALRIKKARTQWESAKSAAVDSL